VLIGFSMIRATFQHQPIFFKSSVFFHSVKRFSFLIISLFNQEDFKMTFFVSLFNLRVAFLNQKPFFKVTTLLFCENSNLLQFTFSFSKEHCTCHFVNERNRLKFFSDFFFKFKVWLLFDQWFGTVLRFYLVDFRLQFNITWFFCWLNWKFLIPFIRQIFGTFEIKDKTVIFLFRSCLELFWIIFISHRFCWLFRQLIYIWKW